MIHWLWLIPAGLIGFFIAALCAASAAEDERIRRIRKYMARIDEAHDRAQHRGGAS